MIYKRNTHQKEIIKKALESCDPHFTAEDVVEAVKNIDSGIGRATVYRFLKEMKENGEFRKFDIRGNFSIFDTTTKNHYHIRCIRCGKVFDVNMDYIENLSDNIKDKKGFEILSHDIVFEGICPDCNNK